MKKEKMAKGKSIALMLVLCIATLMLGQRAVPAGWTTIELVSTESQLTASTGASLGVGPDGIVHIAWEDYKDYEGAGSDYDIFYKRYEPGIGWTTTEVVTTESGVRSSQPSLDVGPDGTVHIAWTEGVSAAFYDVFYKRYEPGIGWTTAEEVSTESVGYADDASLGVGPDGTVHIAWRDEVINPDKGDIFYKRYEPGIGWTTAEEVSTEYADWQDNPSLGVDPDGTVHIAWMRRFAFPDYDVVYKRYEPGIGWTTVETVSSAQTVAIGLYRSPSLGVGPDGTVHIAWSDFTGTWVTVFYRRYEPGIGWTTTEHLSDILANCYVTDVDVGPDGTAHILWFTGVSYDYRSYESGIGWTDIEMAIQIYPGESLTASMDVGPDGTLHFAWDSTEGYGVGPDGIENIYYRRFEVAIVVDVVASTPDGDFSVTINVGADKGAPVTSWTEISTTNIMSYTVTLTDGDMVMVIEGQLASSSFEGQIVLEVDPVGTIITYEINIAPYAGVSVVFEEAHSPLFTIGSNPAYEVTGGYAEFANYLTANGYSVSTIDPGTTIDPSVLAPVDVLVIVVPQNSYSASEIDAIEAWVQGGGRLLLISDWGNNGVEASTIATRFGITLALDAIVDSDENAGNIAWPYYDGANLLVHPVTAGVARVEMYGSDGITSAPADEIPLIVTDTDGTATWYFAGSPALGVSVMNALDGGTAGSGRLIVITDSNAWDSAYNIDGDGDLDFYDSDNEILALNAIDWLAPAINQPPVADANGPYYGTVGEPVAFDGTGSTDPDGFIVEYFWDFGDGWVDWTGPTPSHTYTQEGVYTVTLTVTDDDGAIDIDTTTATIGPTGPRVVFEEAHLPVFTIGSNPAYEVTGGYAEFANYLMANGYSVSTIDPGTTIDASVLSPVDVLVITAPQGSYSTSELDAIVTWVQGGGRLLLISEWGTLGLEASTIATRFGITLALDAILDSDENAGGNNWWPYYDGANLLVHPVTAGVARVEMYGSDGTTPGGVPQHWPLIVTDSDGTSTWYFAGSPTLGVHVMGGITGGTAGSGRLLIITDSNVWDSAYDFDGDGDLNFYDSDNEILALNAIDWLAAAPPALDLSDFPLPFTTNTFIIIPISDPHGPCGAAHTMDTMGGVLIANRLGLEGGVVQTAMDSYSYISTYDFGTASVTMTDTTSQLIVLASPGVNQVAYYYNELTVDGTRVLPVLFLRDAEGDYLYVQSTGNEYRIEYDGATVTAEYGVIQIYQDGDRYVLIVYGLGGESSMATAKVLAEYDQWSLTGTAAIVKYYDSNADGYLDTITIVETIP